MVRIQQSPLEFKPEEDLIKQSRFASNMSISTKDVAGVSRFWMQDFLQVAGDGSVSKGKSKVESEWKNMFKNSSPVFERVPDEVIVSESGLMAWEKGTWYYKNEKYYGNYTAMWKKIKGQWLTQCELYVSLNG